MTKLTKKLLYPGSLFLPTVETSNLQNVVHNVNEYGSNPVSAIAHEVLVLGEKEMSNYQPNAHFLNNLHSLTESDVLGFFQGYSMPLTILTYSCKKDLHEAKRSILNISPTSRDKQKNTATENYALSALGLYRDRLYNSNKDNFMKAVGDVFNYCQTLPLQNDEFYLLGVISAETTFREIFTKINFTNKNFNIPPA